MSIKATFSLAIPFILLSCSTTKGEGSYDLVYIESEMMQIGDVSDGPDELIGVFAIVNQSFRPVCLNEDALVNRLSPYLDVTYDNYNRPTGVPHPPKTTRVTSIPAGERREVRRIVDYMDTPGDLARSYGVVVTMWDCETANTFVRRAEFVRSY